MVFKTSEWHDNFFKFSYFKFQDDLFRIFKTLYMRTNGIAVAQWLRCCATNRKVAGSIPDGVTGIFHRHNPSDRPMALGSTQPLTQMSTRRISWGVNAAGA